MELKDSDGKAFVKEYVEIVDSKGGGWIDFKWSNPVSQEIENKSFYFTKVDDIILGCGIYK